MEEEILHKLEAIPGGFGVRSGKKVTMESEGWHDPILLEGRTYAAGEVPPLRLFKFVSPGFLKTLGTPLVAGREITWTDTYNKIPVAMICESLAREYWGEPANALGKRIQVSTKDDWREIIGVVGNVHDDGVNKKPPSSVYWPLLQARSESEEGSVPRDAAFGMRSPRAGSGAFLKGAR